MTSQRRLGELSRIQAVKALPPLLLIAAVGTFLLIINAITLRQLVGFCLLPLFVKMLFGIRNSIKELATRRLPQWQMSCVGALVTLMYGFRSYMGSPVRLTMLSLLLAWVAGQTIRGSWRDVIRLGGVLAIIGEIVAGAGNAAEIAVGITTVIVWLYLLSSLNPIQALQTVRNSLLLALLVILAGFFLGVSRPYTRAYRFDFDSVQSRGGLTAFRWYLPFTSGWEPPAVLALTLALISFLLLLHTRGESKLPSIAGLVIGFVTVFGVNGRTAEFVFLGGIVAVCLAYFVPWTRIVTSIVGTGLMVLPLLFPLISSLAQQLSTAAVSAGLALDSQRFVTVEGRSVIWNTSLTVFGQAPLLRKLVGYGAQGYISSGAAGLYAGQFGSTGSTGGYVVGYYDTHNLLLTLLLSQGLLGAAVLIICWVMTLRKSTSLAKDLAWAPPFIGTWVFGSMSSTSTACLPSNATYGLIAVVLMIYPFLRTHSEQADPSPSTLSQQSLAESALRTERTMGQSNGNSASLPRKQSQLLRR